MTSSLLALPFARGRRRSSLLCSSKTETVYVTAPPDGGGVGAVPVDCRWRHEDAPAPTASTPSTTQCSAARAQALTPIASVSTGNVSVVGAATSPLEIYVDATAGGINAAAIASAHVHQVRRHEGRD